MYMHWYVAYCKPRKEECAQYHIERKGLEVFFPKLLLPEAGRLQKRVVPLFPNYIFVRLRIAEEYPLVKVEVSSASHPFYTGKHKMLDSGGRVDRFKRQYNK